MGVHQTESDRRTDILERARSGIISDLDELRGELRSLLPPYERQITSFAERAKQQELLDEERLENLFELETEAYDRTIFGPRVVALLAEEVESFVNNWLTGSLDGKRNLSDKKDAKSFFQRYQQLNRRIEKLKNRCLTLEEEAQRGLESEFEELLGQLDVKREDDIGALRELVNEGSLEPGESARHQKADLWEKQREMANNVESFCDDISSHLDRGLSLSQDGFETLLDILSRTKQALLGANPSLSGYINEFSREANETEPVELNSAPDQTEKISQASPELTSEQVDSGKTSEQDRSPRIRRVETSCTRIYQGWSCVPMNETLYGIGIPLFGLLTVASLKAVSLLELTFISSSLISALQNPFVVGGLLAWLLFVPGALGWSTKWRGWRLNFVRETDLEQKASLLVTPKNIRVGSSSYAWGDLHAARKSRWENLESGNRGWKMTIETKSGSTLRIATTANNRDKWLHSELPKKKLPLDTWHIGLSAFESLEESLKIKAILDSSIPYQSPPNTKD